MAGMKMRGHVPPVGMIKKGILKRLMGILFKNYKPLLIIISICLVISAITGAVAGLFLNTVYDTLAEAIAKTISVSIIESEATIIIKNDY